MVDEKRENMWNKNPKMWDILFGKDFYVEVIDKSKNISQLKQNHIIMKVKMILLMNDYYLNKLRFLYIR